MTARSRTRLSRFMIALGFACCASACTITIEAQTLPITLTAQWAPNAATDNVVSYALTLDTGTPIVVQASACSATVCSTPFTVTTAGSHTLSLTASSSIATSTPATLAFNLTVNTPTGFAIHK